MTKRASNPMHPEFGANAFVADLLADWTEHGRAAIDHVRKWKPERYVLLVAAFAARQPAAAADDEDLSHMSDEEITAKLVEIMTELEAAGALPPRAAAPNS